MMVQMYNGKSNAIGLDRDLGWLEVVSLESKEENGRNEKKKLKNHMLQVHMIMRKFHMILRIEPKKKNFVVVQERCLKWFRINM